MQSSFTDKIAQPGKTACGGTLKNTDGFASATCGGERIYFCTQACLHLFELYPDEFITGKIDHSLKAE